MKNKPISSISHKDREKVRMKAGRLFRKGVIQAEVARRLKATPAAVNYWHSAWKEGGMQGLKSKGHTGFASRLTKEKRSLFKRAILKGPLGNGYQTNLWTLSRLRAVMKKETGCVFSEVWVWHIVRLLGFTPQKPQVIAREQDKKAVVEWKEKRLPGLKKMGSQTWVLSGI